jgi:DNA-binding CsgD family transcriptional regulator/tetratricopeptide (TPR) repeat protein
VTRGSLPAIPLVGRDAEVETLVSSLESARSSRARAQTILVGGDIGVGKTRLARLAADEARQRGYAVAAGRAFAVESGLPYAIFADALVPLLRGLEAPVLMLLTRGAGSDMAGILPALFAPSKDAGDESAADSKARMFWSFTELLERLSLRKPLLLLLDNLQWADPASLELLHFVARQTHSAAHGGSLVIVATHADTEGDRHARVRATEQSLVSLGAARVIQLSPLSAEQTVELVHRTFDVSSGAVREFATTLYDWTRGNPFFIEETLKSLVDSGQLHRRNGAWTGWDVEALTPSRTLRDVVLDRAGRLSPAARGLLEVAAVLGARVTLPVLRATSDLPDEPLAEALDELRRTAFLVEEGGPLAFDFAHPLVRDAVYGALGRVRAQAMHDRMAVALERIYGSDAGAHAAELAHHFTCGSMELSGGRAMEYLAQAGRQALARHADRAAVEYLEAAVTHATAAVTATPDDAVFTELIESLARARQRVGDFDGAAALWQRIRERARLNGDSSPVAVAERRMGLMALAAGDPRSALVHFDAGLAALQPKGDAPELTARLLLARANALQAVGRRNDALADAAAALDAATRIGNGGLLARAHRAMLLLYVWTGPSSEARAHGERAVALASASGERTIEWSAHWAMAIHGGLTGDAAATAHHLAEAQRLAEEVRSPVLRLWTADVTIEYLAGIGRWQEALALAEQAIPGARALGQRTLLPRLLVWTGLIQRGLGDLDRAAALIEEAWTLTGGGDESAPGAGDVHAVVPAYTGMAGYLMTAGENARALAVGEAGLAIADRTGYVAWAIYRLLPFIIETALYLEDYERAARHNARLRSDSLALGHALGLAWADTTDALLEYLTGDPARAVPMLRAATSALERVPFVFDAARLRRLVARALLDAGDDESAISELRKAHEIFAALGAEREMRATREQLRAIGARVPPARRGNEGAGALSEREAEIARLVSDRKSNKEIGAMLDISSRTVSTHLSNIFQKLGVASRGELTDRVRSGVLDAKRV